MAMDTAASQTSKKRRPSFDEDDKPRKLLITRSRFTHIIYVEVGYNCFKVNNITSFPVHKDLICKSSTFIKTTCDAAMSEGNGNQIKGPKIKPDTFQVYLDWLYSGSTDLAAAAKELRLDGVFLPSEIAESVMGLFKLCVLWNVGSQLQDASFQAAVMTAFHKQDWSIKEELLTNACLVGRVSRMGGRGSEMRQWLVKSLTLVIKPSNVEEKGKHWPRALALSVLRHALERGQTSMQ